VGRPWWRAAPGEPNLTRGLQSCDKFTRRAKSTSLCLRRRGSTDALPMILLGQTDRVRLATLHDPPQAQR
jgi:hypothetical protein